MSEMRWYRVTGRVQLHTPEALPIQLVIGQHPSIVQEMQLCLHIRLKLDWDLYTVCIMPDSLQMLL